MKTHLTLLGLSLAVWMTVLALVATPAQAATNHPWWLDRSEQILPGTYTAHFSQAELYAAFYQGYLQAGFAEAEAAQRAADLSKLYAGTITLTLTATGQLYSRNLDTRFEILHQGEYRYSRGDLQVQDENWAVGLYHWRLAGGKVLTLSEVADSNLARVIVLTLHSWTWQGRVI